MRAPGFWDSSDGLARLLTPLGGFTRLLTARRVARAGWQPPVPVFCCGNATLGGAGKTTLALDLGQRLRRRGRQVHFLSRGYGGAGGGLVQVDPRRHDARMVGDEPLLLAAVAPCWICADRGAAARAAIGAGAEVLVMDDGLQNPSIAGRHSALVIDGGTGFGNGLLFPAGPLREPILAAASRCEIAVLIGDDRSGACAALTPGMIVLRARLVTVGASAHAGQTVHAFAGIAHPDKFFGSLEQAGARIGRRIRFGDHHRYRPREIDAMANAATLAGAALVTTPKDAARLWPAARQRVQVVGVALEWEHPAAIERWLDAP